MKKIASITWITYPNFGTFLQAYALQQYIVSVGYEDAILDDSTIIETPVSWKYTIKKMLWRLDKGYRRFVNNQKKSKELYESFKRNHLIIDKNIEDPLKLDARYDCYVCGSDQIWNPFSLANPKSGFFYADFTKQKKIAYAPSIGISKMPDEYRNRFKSLIKDFSFLSAREPQGQQIMEELSGKFVANVADPTLLLDKTRWEMLLPKQEGVKDKYILGYFLTSNPIFIEAARKYAHSHGYKFKMFYMDMTYYNEADEVITAGPIEFLEAIHNAEYLFTDSFHGSIFASIFNVQFITFKRFKKSVTSQNSRVENLLKIMKIEERLLSEDEVSLIDSLEKIDFEKVWKNLTPFIKESKEYLNNALK